MVIKFKYLFAVGIFTAFGLEVSGQSTGAEVTFLESGSQNPISGVAVTDDSGTSWYSDASGVARITGLTQNQTFKTYHHFYQAKKISLDPGDSLIITMDPKVQNLREVVVTGYDSERPLMDQAAPVHLLTEWDFNRFNETSLVPVFNTLPGIRFEERAPASFRISIRGSSLRAPFGVRNVKVYWNDIPFTGPEGTTTLNLLDFSNVSRAEVIKGPAGSIFGAGTGGVINLSATIPSGNKATVEGLAGSFGLRRYRAQVTQDIENGAISAGFVMQQSEGYRDHSQSDRRVFHLSAEMDQGWQTHILVSDLQYQIPGALTETQRAENPQQARPGSIDQNSSIHQRALYWAIGKDHKINSKWSNKTALYVTTGDFDHPFILDYKKEVYGGLGGRTRFIYDGTIGGLTTKWTGGAEYQYQRTAAQNFGNVMGQADTLRFSDDLKNLQFFFFTQAEINLSPTWILTGGLSRNYLRYDIDRTADAGPGNPARLVRDFDPVWIPRVALLKKITPNTSWHGSVSWGFSPPTLDEVRTNEGSINIVLMPEQGTSFETGIRSSIWDGKIFADITAFYFRLDETITSFTNDQGVVLFRNAGSTDQPGIEAMLTYRIISNPGAFLHLLQVRQSYTGHFFRFNEYDQRGNDFSGNQLTGVAPHTLVHTVDANIKGGYYANLTWQFTDKIPLNDANTVYQESYQLVNLRMGKRWSVKGKWDGEIFFGVDNLLDEDYSLGNDLNAFFDRFFQPAPGRNYYGGIKVGLNY